MGCGAPVNRGGRPRRAFKHLKNKCSIRMIQFRCSMDLHNDCTFRGESDPDWRVVSCKHMQYIEHGDNMCCNPDAQRAAIMRFIHSGKPVSKITEVE